MRLTKDNGGYIVKRVTKIIIAIFLILVFILVTHIVKNVIIFNKIAKKQKENQNTNNYSFVLESYLSNEEGIQLNTKVSNFYKDKVKLTIMENDNMIWMFWDNGNTKEQVQAFPTLLKARVETNVDYYWGMSLEDTEVSNGFWEILLASISSIKINEEECYKISYFGNTECYNKENGNLLKRTGAKSQKDGVEYDAIVEYKDWKFGELTDSSVARPNIDGYEIVD